MACTHLDHRSEELRAKQSALVAAAADAAFVEAGSDTSVPNPVAHILCGDLNSFDQHDLDAVGWDAVIRYTSLGDGHRRWLAASLSKSYRHAVLRTRSHSLRTHVAR